MLGRLSSFSGPLSNVFTNKKANLILDLQSSFGLSSNTWIDQSGRNNNATLYGNIGTSSLSNNNIVITLDGVDDYIFPENGFGYILDSGFTYEVWFRPGTSSNGVILLETGQATTDQWNDNQISLVSGDINASVYDGDLNPYINGPTFSINTWYNISMTYNDRNDLLSLYIDGDLYSTLIVNKLNPIETYLSLGRPGSSSAYLGGSNGYFKGDIGLWRIWDGSLNSSQIVSNYNRFKSTYKPFQPTQLLLNSSFDNGTSNWTSNRGFGVYSYSSASQPAVLDSILYFTYINTTVSQTVNVSTIISEVNTFTTIINIKHREKSDAGTYTQVDQYSFEVLFKNSSGTTIISKRTPSSGQQNTPQTFTDVSLILNRSEIANFNTISSIQVNISGIDSGYWNGNHGPMVDYVTLTAS